MIDTRLVLLSGGIESATLLHLEHRQGSAHALFIDYGQRAAAQERRAADFHCQALAVPLTVLDMHQLGQAFRAGQLNKPHVPLPHRNLLALSLGLSYAARIGAGRVSLGLNRDDGAACPCGGRPFLERFQEMAHTLGTVSATAPLIEFDKVEVIQQGTALGVDYDRTYSCLLGRPAHCGLCPQCRKRRAALATVGLQTL